MPNLTQLAHEAVRQVVQPGDVVVDATAGNGHDTLFLSELAGPAGRVLAFDLQTSAIEQTTARLEAANCNNVTLLQQSHAGMDSVLRAENITNVSGVMFNLGYLPGDDHTITTQAETTLPSVTTALHYLAPGGIITILAYIGHPGGAEEANAVSDFLKLLDPARYSLEKHAGESPTSPILYIVRFMYQSQQQALPWE